MTHGEIFIRGHSVSREFETAIAGVGAIVEQPEFYKFLTGYQNLLHFAVLVPAVDRNRIDTVAQYLLFPHLDLTRYLSGNPPLLPGMTFGGSIGILLLYWLIFMGLSWIVFIKRDVLN